MKKKRTLLAVLVLATVLLFTACGLGGNGETSDSGESPVITNVLEESGTASNGMGETMEYSFAVPHLALDTAGAEAINQKIDQDLGSYVNKQLELKNGSEGLSLKRVTWQDFWTGDLLSLVIKAEYSDTSQSFYVYNYDRAGGVELDNTALLAKMQKEPADFEQALRQSVAREFDLQAMKIEEDAFDAVQLMRMDALSAANLAPEHIRIFVEEGQLKAVVNMPTPAASGSDSQVITPGFELEESMQKTVEQGFVTAVLDRNTVTITFRETETSDRYMHPVVEYNKPYTVEGLYGNYTDLKIGVLGQDFIPYLFLTDENGQVSFCNIMGCMNAGNRFIAAGPVRLPEAVVSYEDYNDGTANTILAVLQSGSKVDLSDYTVPVEQCIMLPLQASSWSGVEAEQYWMDVHNGGDFPMIWGEVGSESLTSGWIAYSGMTEKGGVYRFVGNVPAGTKTGGYLTLERNSFNVDGHGEFWVEVNVASGSALPGVPVGSTMKMTRSYG